MFSLPLQSISSTTITSMCVEIAVQKCAQKDNVPNVELGMNSKCVFRISFAITAEHTLGKRNNKKTAQRTAVSASKK